MILVFVLFLLLLCLIIIIIIIVFIIVVASPCPSTVFAPLTANCAYFQNQSRAPKSIHRHSRRSLVLHRACEINLDCGTFRSSRPLQELWFSPRPGLTLQQPDTSQSSSVQQFAKQSSQTKSCRRYQKKIPASNKDSFGDSAAVTFALCSHAQDAESMTRCAEAAGWSGISGPGGIPLCQTPPSGRSHPLI